jgi:hypothetical protein
VGPSAVLGLLVALGLGLAIIGLLWPERERDDDNA